MLGRIVERYQAVMVFSLLLILVGMASYERLPRESAPEIRRPLIFINTIYAGVAAADMETLVTKPIEEELDGLEGLDKLTSSSRLSQSTIVAEFTGETEVEVALRRVKERVDIAKAELPEDAEEPFVRELNFSDQPILIVVLSNPAGLEILEHHVDVLEERIKGIQGVLDVTISGKGEKELGIALRPAALRHYGFSIDDVINAVRKENTTIPGGTLSNDKQSLTLAITGEVKSVEIFENLVVKANGREAKLKDLGSVKLGYKDVETIARLDGVPAISLSITKRSGENLIRIVDEVKTLMAEYQKDLPFKSKYVFSFDASSQIKDMLYDLENNIFSSFAMVVLVTLFFLGGVNAVFVSIGIPFSMLISFVVLGALGYTLNMIVLFSLVLALGMLVDNGIVIVENIYRHRSMGKSRVQAAIDGSREVAMPITASTATTILAFFPIIFMPGIMGEFMGYLPKTVIIVLISSLAVALSITPTFCSRFLDAKAKDIERMESGGGAYQRFVAFYEASLTWSIQRPVRVILMAFAIVMAGLVLFGLKGKAPVFFPSLDPEAATVSLEVAPGSSVQATDLVMKQLEEAAPSIESSIETMQTTIGRGVGQEFGPGSTDAAKANIRLGFTRYVDREIPAKQTIAELGELFRDFTGGKVKVQMVQEGPPQGHPVSFEIRGEDYRVIGEIAQKVKLIIEEHREVFEDIDFDFEQGKPEVTVAIDRERAVRFGLSTQQIAATVRNAINGGTIGKFRQGEDEFDVVVRYEEGSRNSIQALSGVEIVGEGLRVPLASLATISPEAGLSVIKRNARRRAVNVWGDFKPSFTDRQEVEAVKKAINDAVYSLKLPVGYSIGIGEGNKEQDKATEFLGEAFLVALGLIFLVLVIQFNSVTQPLIIMISVFLSLGGVFWGLLLSGKVFVIIMSGIGIISLAGVVVNNAIVMIDFINVLARKGLPIQQAAIDAAKTRLRPVLLTALTTVIGLLPMAFAISFDFHSFSFEAGSQSAQWFRSMAWAIIFGLSFATLLTLIVVPTMIVVDARSKAWIWTKVGQLKGWLKA